jgi:hypothetical protein
MGTIVDLNPILVDLKGNPLWNPKLPGDHHNGKEDYDDCKEVILVNK